MVVSFDSQTPSSHSATGANPAPPSATSSAFSSLALAPPPWTATTPAPNENDSTSKILANLTKTLQSMEDGRRMDQQRLDQAMDIIQAQQEQIQQLVGLLNRSGQSSSRPTSAAASRAAPPASTPSASTAAASEQVDENKPVPFRFNF